MSAAFHGSQVVRLHIWSSVRDHRTRFYLPFQSTINIPFLVWRNHLNDS